MRTFFYFLVLVSYAYAKPPERVINYQSLNSVVIQSTPINVAGAKEVTVRVSLSNNVGDPTVTLVARTAHAAPGDDTGFRDLQSTTNAGTVAADVDVVVP